jgi:hypothetical protein
MVAGIETKTVFTSASMIQFYETHHMPILLLSITKLLLAVK